MDSNSIFTKNFLTLYNSSGIRGATALMELINLRAGKKVIDNSYISRMLKRAARGETLNPSIDKAEAVAVGLNTSLSRMINTNPEQDYIELDLVSLESAYRHTDSFCDSAGIDSSEFKARALKLQYEAIERSDSSNLSFQMYQLAKEFNV